MRLIQCQCEDPSVEFSMHRKLFQERDEFSELKNNFKSLNTKNELLKLYNLYIASYSVFLPPSHMLLYMHICRVDLIISVVEYLQSCLISENFSNIFFLFYALHLNEHFRIFSIHLPSSIFEQKSCCSRVSVESSTKRDGLSRG